MEFNGITELSNEVEGKVVEALYIPSSNHCDIYLMKIVDLELCNDVLTYSLH